MTFLFGTNSPFTPSSQSISAPSQAAAFGYNTLTFGPQLSLGSNWNNYNFQGAVPNSGQSVQNADGSVTLSPNNVADGSNYNANISTAYSTGGTNWKGTVFGGGFYVEALLKFPANLRSFIAQMPSFWADDINFLSQNYAGFTWPGQAAGYYHWVETDFFQWAHDSLIYNGGVIAIDWYGPGPSSSLGRPTPSNEYTISPALLLSNYNRVGCLWVPATPTTPGRLHNYFNGVERPYANGTPYPITWNYWNPGSPPAPPPVAGSEITFTALPVGTSATLTSNWTGTTGAYNVTFSDGTYRSVTLTNGQTTATWGASLTSSPSIFASVAGSAYSWIDQSQRALILGTDISCPMTVASVSVWQASTAGNLVQ